MPEKPWILKGTLLLPMRFQSGYSLMAATWSKVKTDVTRKPFSEVWVMPNGWKGEKQIFMTKPDAKRVFDRIYGQMGALASIKFTQTAERLQIRVTRKDAAIDLSVKLKVGEATKHRPAKPVPLFITDTRCKIAFTGQILPIVSFEATYSGWSTPMLRTPRSLGKFLGFDEDLQLLFKRMPTASILTGTLTVRFINE